MPTLSVLTPSYNYAWCIEDALASVRSAAQYVPTGWDVEHVVVDDASADESPAVLERRGASITAELRRENHGQSSTLNRCLDLSSGDWIGWLNADDFYLPWALRDACSAMNERTDVVHGDAVILDVDGRFSRLLPEHRFSLWTLRHWGTYLPVGSVFLRREVVADLGWKEDLSLLLDWDLWLRAAEAGARFHYVPRPLVAARFHAGQESHQPRPGRLDEKIQVRRDHGIQSVPRTWRAVGRVASVDHGLRKVVNGGYARQLRSRRLKGSSMRWFARPEDRVAVAALYEAAYGLQEGALMEPTP
jgi:Glycosyl transferase family 2